MKISESGNNLIQFGFCYNEKKTLNHVEQFLGLMFVCVWKNASIQNRVERREIRVTKRDFLYDSSDDYLLLLSVLSKKIFTC